MTHPPHGTPEAPRLAVRGEARLEVDPEVARLDITVSARGTDRHDALAQLTRRNNATLELVRSYADAVHKLETGAFSLTPELGRHGRTERVRAYHGRVHLTAHLTDFTALGELTTRLAGNELTRLGGPWWDLHPDSPAHREARQLAVREAVQRAREYAEALGTTLDSLLELADIGAESPAPQPGFGRAGRGARRALGGSAEEEPAPLDLEPQRQTVHAQVNARFTLHPPRL
ncbi:SIMPL domain-containing protein [Streptomyces physcomitrii]|uniref:SIMPL domain-containing protein n=1 Tax=Streptomyces physcomitrii TaxID=2724184 RepID=UPI0033C5C9E9